MEEMTIDSLPSYRLLLGDIERRTFLKIENLPRTHLPIETHRPRLHITLGLHVLIHDVAA